jgi:hypothetical protein
LIAWVPVIGLHCDEPRLHGVAVGLLRPTPSALADGQSERDRDGSCGEYRAERLADRGHPVSG